MRGTVAVVLIILAGLAVACLASATLGDPRAPAAAVRPLALPEFRIGLDGSAAEATAVSARATADALRARDAAATQQAIQATSGAERYRTQEALRYSQESTAIVQGTERAHLYMLQGWTATADAVQATSSAALQATASSAAYTRTARADELAFQERASVATATQAALVSEQRKQALELRSQEIMTDVWAITKWAVPVVLVVLFGVLQLILVAIAGVVVFRRMEYRVIMPAPNGDKPLVLHRGKAIDPDLLPQAVTDLARPGELPLDRQLEVKTNDQRIDAARALPRTLSAPAIPSGPGFTVLPAGALPPAHLLPDPDVTGIIDGEWDAAK